MDNILPMADLLQKLSKYSHIALACGIIGILLVLLFPVPTPLLDILLAFSIAVSVLILMTTLFIHHPLELSVFPTILLVTTIMRLSLNIASTRLILANGHTGPSAAGHVIEAFGSFVMQGNVVIGLIVFLILTIINFIVITKGSGRIAEVAARFSLDAMPGKQMAIDADLAAGLIDEAAARERRKTLEDESTFYGAMDGANKFVRGDAIAGLIITFINLVGGMIIGILQRNLSFDSAIKTYSMLTIGDGLVAQIPSLIISLAAGLLVTNSGSTEAADKAIFGQLGKYPQSLGMAALVTGLMAFLPGLPFLPFFTLSLITGMLAHTIYSSKKDLSLSNSSLPSNAGSANTASTAGTKSKTQTDDDAISEVLQLDSIRLELGYNLLSLINHAQYKLPEQIKSLRLHFAKNLGFILPSVRIQDNLQLEQNKYVIKIKEIPCASGEVRSNKLMIMDPMGQDFKIAGEDVKDPAFGLSARWIEPSNKEEALFNRYTVIDPTTVITTHLTEVIKDNITELLSYSETQRLIDTIGEENKKLVSDTIPELVPVVMLQKILQNLLAESVSIRDLPTIIDAAANAARASKNIATITEMVRSALARQISASHTTADGFIPVITLSSEWESEIVQHIINDGDNQTLSLAPSRIQSLISKIKHTFDDVAGKGPTPVVLTSSTARPYVRAIIERFRPSTIVMSQNEIHQRAKIRTLGII